MYWVFIVLKYIFLMSYVLNGLFNSLLLDLRKDVLPSVVNNWDSFSNTEQTNLIEMGNFFVKFIH